MASPNPTRPRWPHCGHGTTDEDPVGCRGRRIPGDIACLAHAANTDRAAYLAGLTPGADVDHRGTSFTPDLLDRLLNALRDPVTGHPRLGTAQFASATFAGDTPFGKTIFEGNAEFQMATFKGDAEFREATFQGNARFREATFEGYARFWGATFKGEARFRRTTFMGYARFWDVTFEGYAGFGAATFKGDCEFWDATFESTAVFGTATFERDTRFGTAAFKGDAWFAEAVFKGQATFTAASFVRDAVFTGTVFETVGDFGPFVCAGQVRLSEAVFRQPVTLRFAARHVESRRTRWASTAELRLRHATVDFTHAVFEYPLTIAAEADPFVLPDGRPVAEHPLTDASDPAVRIVSLRGVDAAHLVLADVDLSGCVFTGTVHLDQLRLEGNCSFGGVPPRRSSRRTLAEERHWRARRPRAARGWGGTAVGSSSVGPAQLAPVYRALRKAFEDGKNEPGAADFYYGEMEMRRHDRVGSSRAERGLLHGYWLLSGYGLRASRALGWLAVAMLTTVLLLMGAGLPQDSPQQVASGTVPAGGGRVTFEIDKADPRNPTADRFTTERFEKALSVTLNSVVFRSSGQDLTTAGTYTEMASRVAEPVLLGLAVLAVRNRVRR